eukprot:650700-Rhodomonas_salina.2
MCIRDRGWITPCQQPTARHFATRTARLTLCPDRGLISACGGGIAGRLLGHDGLDLRAAREVRQRSARFLLRPRPRAQARVSAPRDCAEAKMSE